MTPEHWRDVERLYNTAVDLGPDERSRFLATVADESLRREVESLLNEQTAAESFFDTCASAYAAPSRGRDRSRRGACRLALSPRSGCSSTGSWLITLSR
jgi:hypothetical protein